MKKFFLFTALSVILAGNVQAQDTVRKAVLPPPPDMEDLQPPKPKGEDVIYRGNILPVDPPRRVYRGLIRSGRGFRVQIYSGSDRAKAIAAKSNFMRIFPDVRTYLSYSAPQFKVKVGDYKSRTEAAGMARVLKSFFKPVMIVPDVIVVNSLKQ